MGIEKRVTKKRSRLKGNARSYKIIVSVSQDFYDRVYYPHKAEVNWSAEARKQFERIAAVLEGREQPDDFKMISRKLDKIITMLEGRQYDEPPDDLFVPISRSKKLQENKGLTDKSIRVERTGVVKKRSTGAITLECEEGWYLLHDDRGEPWRDNRMAKYGDSTIKVSGYLEAGKLLFVYYIHNTKNKGAATEGDAETDSKSAK